MAKIELLTGNRRWLAYNRGGKSEGLKLVKEVMQGTNKLRLQLTV